MLNWFRNNKLPITEDDKIWVDENIEWLKQVFEPSVLDSIKTIKPSPEFFDYQFTGNMEDAIYVLKQVKSLMFIQNEKIDLEFITDGYMESENGTMLASPADGIKGTWSSAAGTYRKEAGNTIISIDTKTLKNPENLISTMAHELSHELLLGEQRIIENDEYLTDLTAVFFGFGIFIGNSKFKFEGYSSSDGSGWAMNSQGYLPEPIIAYAMAKLSMERGENIDYLVFLDKSIKRHFKKCINFFKNN